MKKLKVFKNLKYDELIKKVDKFISNKEIINIQFLEKNNLYSCFIVYLKED